MADGTESQVRHLEGPVQAKPAQHMGDGGGAITWYLTDDKRKRIKNRQIKMCTDYTNLNAAKIQDMDILEQETYRSVFW